MTNQDPFRHPPAIVAVARRPVQLLQHLVLLLQEVSEIDHSAKDAGLGQIDQHLLLRRWTHAR